MGKDFRTAKSIERERKHKSAAAEMASLLANPDNSKMPVYEYVMQKYGIKSLGTIYRIKAQYTNIQNRKLDRKPIEITA